MSLVIERFPDIGITRLSRWIFNCYLIHGKDSCVVVDAGLPGSADDVAGVLSVLGGTVVAVVATHGHSDHVAGAPRLIAETSASLHLPEVTVGYLDGTVRPRTPSIAKVARIWPTVVSQPFDATGGIGLIKGAEIAGFGGSKGMLSTGLLEAKPLVDGAPLPGIPGWQIVAVPGHTDDSVAFWHADSATLISGDAVLTAGGCAWFTPETVDHTAALHTEKRLRSLPAEHLLPGHGLPVRHRDVWAGTR